MSELKLIHHTERNVTRERIANGGYDYNDPDMFHLQYGPGTQSVVEMVVKAAAFVHNVENVELEPLSNVIDPDALDALIGPNSENPSTRAEFTFEYEGLQITVNNSGDIWLEWL